MLTYSPVSSVPLHDALPIYAAENHKGAPSVILCKTVKGFLMGKWGESQNITHQQKKLDDEALKEFRRRVYIDIPDEAIAKSPFQRLPEDSPEMKYLHERRKRLGGYLPQRRSNAPSLTIPP